MLMASAQGLSDIVSNLARENPESVNRTSGVRLCLDLGVWPDIGSELGFCSS